MKVLLLIILVIILMSVLQEQETKQHAPPDAVAWVTQHYTEFPLGGGWQFTGAVAQGGQVQMHFLIPRPIGTHHEQRQRILKSMCPGREEAIWKRVPGAQLSIYVYTRDRQFDAAATCKTW